MRVLALLLCLLCWPLGLSAQTAESDRGYIQGLLEDALSGPGRSVRMTGFEGALSSRATVESITVSDEAGIWLTLEGVALQWTRSQLLRGRIDVDEISVERLLLPRMPEPLESAPTPEASAPFALPELPVAVLLEKLRVERAELGEALFGEAAVVSLSGAAELVGGAGDATLMITRRDKGGEMAFEGAYDNSARQLRLDFSLTEPAGGIVAHLLNIPERPALALSVKGDDPIDMFRAALTLATDGQERLAGDITFDQSAGQRFELDLGGDLAPVLAPQYREFLGDAVQLTASARRLESGALSLDALELSAAAMRLSGMAELRPEGWPQRFDLALSIDAPQGGSVTLPLPGAPVNLGAARLSATYDAKESALWRLDGTVDGLTRETMSFGLARLSGAGSLSPETRRVRGGMALTLEAISFGDPALAEAVGKQLAADLQFEARPNAPFKLSEIFIAGEDYALTGKADIASVEEVVEFVISPDLKLRAERLTRFVPLAGLALEGAAELALRGEVRPVSGAFDLRVEGLTEELKTGIAQLDPLLSGKGRLALGLVRDETGLVAEPLEVRSDHAQITGRARLVSEASTLSLRLQIPQLGRAIAGANGAADLTLDAIQTGNDWKVALGGAAPGAARVKITASLNDLGTDAATAEGGLKADIDQISAYSGLARQALSGAAQLSAEGRYALQSRDFRLSAEGQTQSLGLGAPSLDALLGGALRFDLAAEGRPEDIRIERFVLKGRGIDGSVTGKLGAGGEDIAFALTLPELQRIVPQLSGPARLSGTAERRGAGYLLRASGTGPGGLTLAADGTVAASGRSADLALSGAAPLALVNSMVQSAVVTGQARYDLRLNGPIALRALSGRIGLSGAGVALPTARLRVVEAGGSVRLLGGNAQVDLSGRFENGGTLNVSGPVGLSGGFPADLAVRITQARLSDGRYYEGRLGGAITLRGPLADAPQIGGRVDIAEMEVRLPQIGPSYAVLGGLRHVAPSTPVRRTLRYAGLTPQGTARAAGAALPIDLIVSAPSRLFVRGRGLDAELGGQLRLTGTTQNLQPIGQFELIRGRLALLGRRLDLMRGSVALRGDIDPIINFEAVSTVEGVDVALGLRGAVSAPQLEVSSVPELPQDEALALFLFGRSVSELSALQAVRLASAIRTLSGRGGLGFTNKLRQGLNVDDFDLSIDEDGAAELKVGKYISDKVYTDVTLGSDGNTQIELNLDVSNSVKLKGKVGTDGETGIGVFFEKDY